MRRRIIMSMLAGVTLLAGTLLGASPAPAVQPTDATAAQAARAGQPADPPAEFGTDWHDPLTAAPPVAKPAGKAACEVTVAEARFRDFTPYTGTYTPPRGCGDRWSKVVLRLDGRVKGRQFDRLGYLHIGGVEVFRTSTPQPSPDGIEWSVEKDVTRYSDTFREGQDVEMLIGNVVDDTYTGVIDVKVTLTFYAPDKQVADERVADKPAAIPDRVLTLQDGTLTTPRNSERIVAEVYPTGSGGGCEEYWYLTVPDTAPYSCKADDGPYREVQIKVDGQPAGIAAPFPTVWTGGWSNPFLRTGTGSRPLTAATRDEGELSIQQAAVRLGVLPAAVAYQIRAGHLPARHGPTGRVIIPWNDQVESDARSQLKQPKHPGPTGPGSHPLPETTLARGELSIQQIATRLSIRPGALYYSIARGRLDTRRGKDGRLSIPWTSDNEDVCRQLAVQTRAHTPQTQTITTGGAV